MPMLVQIALGSAMIAITTVMMAVVVATAMIALEWLNRSNLSGFLLVVQSLVCSTFFMIAGLSAAIWMWAIVFFYIGAFEGFYESLYFCMVAFTTLGFGDVTLPNQWKLQSGFIATNGLIIFGISTAFLIDVLREHQVDSGKQRP